MSGLSVATCMERSVRFERRPQIFEVHTVNEEGGEKCLGFHIVKSRKVGGRSTSPEGRAVLHQAMDKSYVLELVLLHELVFS